MDKKSGNEMVIIAGVDEAGRGPLAGPVVAAAVILPKYYDLRGLDDSKKVTPKKRSQLFVKIQLQATAIGVGGISATEIQKTNILEAIPMNKFGKPSDVASLVAFLSSEESAYITGQNFHINGGMLMV